MGRRRTPPTHARSTRETGGVEMLGESLFTYSQVVKSRALGGRHYNWVQWDLAKRNAELYGNRPAISDTLNGIEPGVRRTKTWREVFSDANTMIMNLADRGLRPGAVVVSHLPSTIESAYLDIVTSKLSAMHLGLNVDLGKAETLAALHQVKPDAAVIVSEWHGREFAAWYREARQFLPGLRIFVLPVEGKPVPEDMEPLSVLMDEAIWERYETSGLDMLRTDPLTVHELLPTAGTTGVPKISRRTTLDWFHVHSVCIAERAEHTVYDSRLLIGPLSGGSGRLWGVHTPLYTGGSVLYLTEFNEEHVLALTEAERFTIWVWNPALITRVVTSPGFMQHGLKSLRQVSYSGAPMPGEVLSRLMDRGILALNVYGTSEVGGCMSPILPGITREQVVSAAGKPFEGFDVPIVDRDGNRLGPGEIGEILIWNVHHGYFDAPEESRTIYHDEEYGGRWEGYQHTGDLGVYDEDGYLRVVGRKKDMILRGSQNIFPKEIEDILSQHPAVRDIAVVAMPDPVLGERVCAFVVPNGDVYPRVDDLSGFLAERGVAKFKWPERVEILMEMPLGPGGKIQKNVLRDVITKKLEAPERTA